VSRPVSPRLGLLGLTRGTATGVGQPFTVRVTATIGVAVGVGVAPSFTGQTAPGHIEGKQSVTSIELAHKLVSAGDGDLALSGVADAGFSASGRID
jgi:hypothetical protein